MMNILMKIPAIVIMIGIFTLSSLPGDDPLLNVFSLSDKIKHFIAYFVLGTTCCIWISRKNWLAKPIFWCVTVIVLCTVFGVLDEYHQSFVPGRSGNDLGDLAANFIGGLVSVFLYLFIALKCQKLIKE
jgi:VanZ family protein